MILVERKSFSVVFPVEGCFWKVLECAGLPGTIVSGVIGSVFSAERLWKFSMSKWNWKREWIRVNKTMKV